MNRDDPIYLQVVSLLDKQDLTAQEMQKILKHKIASIRSGISRARELGFIRISDWRRNIGSGGRESPVFSMKWANEQDVPKPELDRELADKERRQRYNERFKAQILLRRYVKLGLDPKDAAIALANRKSMPQRARKT